MVKEIAASNSSSSCPFVFIQVNAMYFTDAKQLFAEVWTQYSRQTTGAVSARRVAGVTARRRLNAIFETVDKTRPAVLMLIDELDQLSTKKQELIYDIFNWTAVEAARVSVISIANTLDLPERMLNQRISSRLGMNRIVFQPYSHEEMERIIVSKLGGSKGLVAAKGKKMRQLENDDLIIESDAVQLAARKVAAISGDLRKAMEILRSAIERAIVKGEERLTMTQVNEAIRAASSTLLVTAVNSLAGHQLYLFESAVDIIRTRDVEEFSMSELLEKYEVTTMVAHEKTPLAEDVVWRIAMTMARMGLLELTNPNEKARFRRRLRLVPAVHDAVSALKITTDKRVAAAAAANLTVYACGRPIAARA